MFKIKQAGIEINPKPFLFQLVLPFHQQIKKWDYLELLL